MSSTSRSSGCLGCLGVILVVGFIGSILDPKHSSSSEGSSAVSADSAADNNASAREDSVLAVAFLQHPDTLDRVHLLRMDAYVHDRGSGLLTNATFANVHNSVHSRAVTLMLDSASRLLRATHDRGPAPALAEPQLNAIHAPLSPAQKTRLASLKSRLADAYSAIQKEAKQAALILMADQRRAYAKTLEDKYLDEGLDVTVTTHGAQATTLHIKWILANRVLVHQFSKDGELWDGLRRLGFKHLELSDGYDNAWSWTID